MKLFDSKGIWLPKEGRWSNLERGQWKPTPWVCKVFGHDFVDPRIDPYYKKIQPQTEEKCSRCGLEREYVLR